MRRQDYKVRRSIRYRFKRWLFSDHREELVNALYSAGEFIVWLLIFLAIFIIPSFLH